MEVKAGYVMDSARHPSSLLNSPSKSRLALSIAKVLHIRAVTEKSSDNDLKKKKKKKKKKKMKMKSSKVKSQKKKEDEDNGRLNKAVEEAFAAKLFASISAIKAAYAQLQYAQSPYDADAIQSADQMVVSQLKKLSELKRCYSKNQLDEESPQKTLLLAEIQEQSSLVKTYEITAKKLESHLKLKDSEITFLKEKLDESNDDVKSLKKRLSSSSGKFVYRNDVTPSDLRPSHFIAFLNLTAKSVRRRFVQWIIGEMESSNWDLSPAADAIHPGINFWESNHRVFAFESYVCREMFNGFNRPFFDEKTESFSTKEKKLIFDRFKELKSMRALDYLPRKPTSKFASFCRAKYLKLVHRDMEASLFGNLRQRNLIQAGDFPETAFFAAFAEMAKSVWLLHFLAFSFEPEVSIFDVAKGTRYSEVFMESLSDEAFASRDDPRVAFSVSPGFRVGKTVVQCQVYLC